MHDGMAWWVSVYFLSRNTAPCCAFAAAKLLFNLPTVDMYRENGDGPSNADHLPLRRLPSRCHAKLPRGVRGISLAPTQYGDAFTYPREQAPDNCGRSCLQVDEGTHETGRNSFLSARAFQG